MLVSAFQWLPERRLGVAATLAHADELIEQVGELLFGYLAEEGGVVSIKEVPKGPVPVQLYPTCQGELRPVAQSKSAV
ncbi:hypothetical protein [Cryobacterium sp. TMT2-23]|uniref:hypothetical protein n=1 Tax=Cryobacterium sp. TMT2-23 TaxID=1259252 RepID=UPI00106BCB6E|nr:hypothetical protein [Cryobacterium sp. TMT2-23]TFD16411.1 hypothetical protein E3T32_15385 [Cryobacterium sp. TMT2-23]